MKHAPPPKTVVQRLVGWASRREQTLLESRPIFTLLLLSTMALVAGLLILTILGCHLLPLSSTDYIEGMLAAGTLALANSTLTQAVLAQRTRDASLRPNLYLRIEGEGLQPGPVDLTAPLAVHRYWTAAGLDLAANATVTLLVENLGPGIGVDLAIWVRLWWSPIAPLKQLEVWNSPLGVPQEVQFPAQSAWTIPTGGNFVFPLRYILVAPVPGKVGQFSYGFVRRLEVGARCLDIEGTPGPVASISLGMVNTVVKEIRQSIGGALGGDKSIVSGNEIICEWEIRRNSPAIDLQSLSI